MAQATQETWQRRAQGPVDRRHPDYAQIMLDPRAQREDIFLLTMTRLLISSSILARDTHGVYCAVFEY